MSNRCCMVCQDHLAVRLIVFKLTRGDAPDTAKMNARAREMIKETLSRDGVEKIFKLGEDHGKEIGIFGGDYPAKIEKIKLPNTKIKLLQQLLTKAIADFKKGNKIMDVDFSKKFQALVEYCNEPKEQEVWNSEELEGIAGAIAEPIEVL